MAESRYNFGRIDRIGNIRQRYRDNIGRYLRADVTPLSQNAGNRAISVSRNVYMGLNQG